MEREIKLGYAGLGNAFWKNHLPSIREIEELSPSYGFDVLKECETYGVKRIESFRELLETLSRENGALVLTSPDNVHFKQTIEALSLGIPIFAEKPMALIKEECDEIKRKVNSTNLVYMLGLASVEYSQFRKMKELFQMKFGDSKDLEGLTIEAGYYHDLFNTFKKLRDGGSNFHLKQNYLLGGGIHALASVLHITNSKVKEVGELLYKSHSSWFNENPVVYSGEMNLTNGIKLTLTTDVIPQINILNVNNIKERGQVYVKISDKERIIMETRQRDGKSVVFFLGKEHEIELDMTALTKLYQEFLSSILENRTPKKNDVEFAYNCTVPIIESLDMAKIPRWDLE